MLFEGEPFLVTLELPWRDNQHQISCIPEGDYVVKKVINRITHGGMALPISFELSDVPNRAGILIHPGNTISDTRGCILVGLSFGMLDFHPAIIGSKVAYDELITKVGLNRGFNLKISHG